MTSFPPVFAHHEGCHLRLSVLGHPLARLRKLPGADHRRPERQEGDQADDDGGAAAVRQRAGEVGLVVRVLHFGDVVLDEQNGQPVAGLEIRDSGMVNQCSMS